MIPFFIITSTGVCGPDQPLYCTQDCQTLATEGDDNFLPLLQLLLLLLLLSEARRADAAALKHQHCLSWFIRQNLQRRIRVTKNVLSC